MADNKIYHSSTFAPVNIAVIKYWGKRDPSLNLPTNSSLSVTLSQSDLRTHTTASCSPSYSADSLTLNGSPQDISGARTQACLYELRSLRRALESSTPSLPPLSTYPLKIVSQNNFPTAAGLASSAAGFAALVRSIADLYALPSSPTELSRIARQGSGSACRSLFGGYVAWEMGSSPDGSDSVAVEVAPASHWPGMRAVILVASAEKKDVSSTSGMQATVKTSTLFRERVARTVPERMEGMKKAVQERDFETFATLTMRDSNSFHACCLDTEPAIFYMNDASKAAVRVVDRINETQGRKVAAYTFDAGPNAVVYYEEKDEGVVAGVFKSILGEVEGWEGEKGGRVQKGQVPEGTEAAVEKLKSGISRVILTGVGEGPIKTEETLIDEKGETI
ncbi:Diphosphomevalonate decarboxylase [Elsinoe fawcettii]|nr:Diphosphomevalonate decarboxylase [Elsinoe fawcettii]